MARRNPWADNEIVDYGEPMDVPDPEIESLQPEARDERPAWSPFGDIVAGLVPKIAAAYEAQYKLASKCESPIELALGVAVLSEIGHLLDKHALELRPQFWWRQFRIDFAVLRSGGPVLLIECDGREFHSTPEQLANDRRKDQAAEFAGLTLLRFSGSEIHRYPDGCVHRVLEHLVRVEAV